jgi:hypothetical protein
MDFKDLPDGTVFKMYDERLGVGMLDSEVRLCRADELCPYADFILFTDSDCIFTKPVCPADYFVGGKPVMLGKTFASMEREKCPALCWRQPTIDALGFAPEYETMRRHPAVHPRGLFAPFRAAVEKHTGRAFDEYVLGCKSTYPQGFAEFPSLGAFALKTMPEQYHFVDVDGPGMDAKADSGSSMTEPRLTQFWSHHIKNGVIPEEIRKEIEACLV